MKTINNTKVQIVRDHNTHTLVDGSKVFYPTWYVKSERIIDDECYAVVNRRFSDKKFEGSEGARKAADTFGAYLQGCSLHQYVNANRRRGRPFDTELYADISLVA
jgi:hypothetical protein